MRAPWRREGRRRRRAFAARKRPRWDEFRGLAERAARRGLDSFASARAARLRRPIPGGRRRPGPGAHLRGGRRHAAVTLERLAAAGHNALYREERGTWRRMWEVLARECPAADRQAARLRAHRLPHLHAAGRGGLSGDPGAAGPGRRSVLPTVMIERAEAGAERKAEGRRYVDVALEDRPFMASGIITNNVRVAIACFAGGVFLGVGSLVLLGYNGLAHRGARGALRQPGTARLPPRVHPGPRAAGAVRDLGGGRGRVPAGPLGGGAGRPARGEALVLSGRTAVRMVGGAAMLLVAAGMIEGFVSAGAGDVAVRAAASAVSLAFLVAYLLNGSAAGRRRLRAPAASTACGSPGPRSPAGWLTSRDRTATR